MQLERLDRRSVLKTAGAWTAIAAIGMGLPVNPLAAQGTGASEPFTPDHVVKLAEKLAAAPYVKPRAEVPPPFDKLTYDQYRDIRFRPDQSVWRGEGLETELQMFPLGFLYDIPVDIWLIEGANARQLAADGRVFELGPLIAKGSEVTAVSDAAPYAFSGFRVHGTLNRADTLDEYVVFQGASYFRAVARGQVYGLSARGLAIDTARPSGEEFPIFRAFWIEKPAPGAKSIVVHALLDSASATGAYRFSIKPGEATVMDVDATIYPRRTIAHAGIAPLTSMYLHGSAQSRLPDDFRPSVHDSEGLAIINGLGERLWRPLTNPKTLQASAFIDKHPKGFGLAQRDRAFASFEDLEAQYQRRPSVWVEPKGDWGEGYVELIEIPATEEIHDNIVAYWKPATGLEAGRAHAYSYTLTWSDALPVAWTGAWVQKTRTGAAQARDTRRFAIDFIGPGLKDLPELPVADVTASAGSIANVVVQKNSEISGLRVTFDLATGGTDVIELRLALKLNNRTISESWMFRWTRA